MKTLHFVSILVLATAATFACSDDDALTPGGAGASGASGAAGKNGGAGSSTAGKSNSTAGSSAAGSAAAGKSGGSGAAGSASAGTAGNATAGTTSTAGSGGSGAGPANDGGVGGGGAGGDNQAGSGGEAGGAAGAGGAPSELGGANAGGAGGEGGASTAAPLEISGEWDDGFGTETITNTGWLSFGSTSAILSYDNDANVLYLQLPTDDPYNPNTFSKVVYTAPVGDAFYYCTIAYGLATLEAALADTTVADASDPEDGGCGSFPWSQLTRL